MLEVRAGGGSGVETGHWESKGDLKRELQILGGGGGLEQESRKSSQMMEQFRELRMANAWKPSRRGLQTKYCGQTFSRQCQKMKKYSNEYLGLQLKKLIREQVLGGRPMRNAVPPPSATKKRGVKTIWHYFGGLQQAEEGPQRKRKKKGWRHCLTWAMWYSLQ